MSLGGGFSLASKKVVYERPPQLVKSTLGIFRLRSRRDIVLTLRDRRPLPRLPGGPGTPASPLLERDPLDAIFHAYREMIEAAAVPLAPGVVLPVGASSFREQLLSPSKGPLLLSVAIADSIATRYNDLALKLCEHWAAVVEVDISRAALSLHQRHINRLQTLAGELVTNAARLREQIDLLSHFDDAPTVAPAAFDSRDFITIFAHRAHSFADRVAKLNAHIDRLVVNYRTSLDEGRNWMVTALTLFTAGTWPLSFLTGYFGMNFGNMSEMTVTDASLGTPLPIPGVPGIQIFWLFFGIFLAAVLIIFERMQFFANLW
jgi:hypothetical protein